MSAEPEWVRHALWWHIYPLGFTGADPTGCTQHQAGGFGQLIDWLDYAVRLGVSGIQLGPIFASATHGYDTTDYYRVDPRLGDDRDFDRFLTAAHDRGLRVLLDGVFNHVGRQFPAFAEVLAQGPAAPHADWFRLTWTGASEPDYASFEGHRELVALDHDNPAVVDYVGEAMTHWLARGIDGWRLDAAYAVPREFWRRVIDRVRAAYPAAYLYGEVIHGDYAAVVSESGMDAVTQYELWKAVWSSLNDRNFFELAWALKRHNEYLDTFVPVTFVGNHDVTRIASRLTDERHLAHALVILFTTGGTPAIYYGDEQAFRGIKEDRAGGDDAIRPAFPATPEDLAPYGWPTYRLHQDLIGLRRRNSWLHAARTEIVELTNQRLAYDATDGTHRLRVLLNIADTETPAPPGKVLAGTVTDQVAAHGWVITG
jgi:cyclomaltodextrinase